MSTFNETCLNTCSPVQILNLNLPVNDASLVSIYKTGDVLYDVSTLKYSYSVDGVCWSCYMTLDSLIESTLNTISDYFLRVKVPGEIIKVESDGISTIDYTTSLDSSFNLESSCDKSTNLYNPYANIDCAIKLQQSLSNMVTCVVGIPIYYFKANGIKNSADITFKEYALKSIESVKQIKLVVPDGLMPSSKPEFADIGLDWQTDWETEISKSMFATAFGRTAQPMEGDLIYIPMQKRMWMVNEAYDERNESLMWQSTTWKVALVKYQADASMDLNGNDDFIDELVKNKYEDLFGNDEALDSGIESVALTKSKPDTIYPVYKSDATRKEMTCDTIDFQNTNLYHKGTLIMDNCYTFTPTTTPQITYQRQYCGSECTISFIIKCTPNEYNATIINIGRISINISQNKKNSIISINNVDRCQVTLKNNEWYFVTIRFSKTMNIVDITASINKCPDNIPLYRLTNYHYYFDVDNCLTSTARWNSELVTDKKSDIIVYGFHGNISNIKVFDVYNDKMSELMMQYPTHQHLLINDTARPLYGLLGVTPK